MIDIDIIIPFNISVYNKMLLGNLKQGYRT